LEFLLRFFSRCRAGSANPESAFPYLQVIPSGERSVCLAGALLVDVTAWIRFDARRWQKRKNRLGHATRQWFTMNTNAICEISWPKK
jgi:hypothetical protein